MIRIGTAGFKYSDWKGSFYPPELKDREMLRYYAGIFNTVELDFTYYHMPNARTLAAMEKRTPPGFHFTVKAHRSMTHEILSREEELVRTFTSFHQALTPLLDAGKLGSVLAQFPWSYRPGPGAIRYLRSWPQRLSGIPLVVEFRHTDWLTQDTFQALMEEGMGFCCVDEPALPGLLPPLAIATAPIAYVRYHGRNARKWWRHQTASERYDYLYAPEELIPWVGRIQELANQAAATYVMFNNCHAGQATTNARMMRDLLAQSG